MFFIIHLVPDSPQFPIRPIALGDLRTSFQNMSTFSASGLDHWSVRAVKSLPDCLLDKLCSVFNVIEQTGDWLASLTVGYLSLIPKAESDNSPSSLRPLSILSVLYRASSQSGFRFLRDCFDAWYPLALKVEKSMLTDEPLCGSFLDFEKAFDLVPLHEIILPLAKYLGLPDIFCQLSIQFLFSSSSISQAPQRIWFLFAN